MILNNTNISEIFAKMSTHNKSHIKVTVVLHQVLVLFSAVYPYSLEGKLGTSALDRLEAAGVPVLTSLAEVPTRLLDEIGMTVPDSWGSHDPDTIAMRNVLPNRLHTLHPPNWSSLCGVLKRLDLEELSQHIEDCLSDREYHHLMLRAEKTIVVTGVMSLKELCVCVIVRALLQQRSLDSDQLQDTLPDYVPPTLKHSILHHFKTHTLQLLPATPTGTCRGPFFEDV